MEVRFYINQNIRGRPEFKAELDRLMVRYEYIERPSLHGHEAWKYIRFNISENDPLWLAIRELLDRHGLKAGRRVIYSKRDIETAEWLRLRPDSQSLGYPKNLDKTYHDESCARCGICEQIAPFRLSSEPKIKTKHFFGIGWIHEEVFAHVEVQTVFESLGITGVEYLRPVKHRAGKPFELITQLKVNKVLPAALFTEECEMVTCCENNEEGQNQPANRLAPLMTVKELTAKRESGEIGMFEQIDPADVDWSGIPPGYPCCGRVKYHVIYKHQAKFSREAFKDAPDFVKTNEWFGSWHHAGRETLISQRAARVILENKCRGVQLEPIALI